MILINRNRLLAFKFKIVRESEDHVIIYDTTKIFKNQFLNDKLALTERANITGRKMIVHIFIREEKNTQSPFTLIIESHDPNQRR